MNYPKYFYLIWITILSLYIISCKSLPTLTDRKSEPFEYKDYWSKVDSLEQLRLPESALSVVSEIKAQARVRGDQIEKIKALIYEGKYRSEIEDLELAEIINSLESEIQDLESPGSEILHSYLGELYDFYIRQNSWSLQDRKETLEGNRDLAFMTLAELTALADRHFKSSIDHPERLKVDLDSIDLLLLPSPLPKIHRYKTIYEMLAQRALDHFQNNDFKAVGLSPFLMNTEVYFAPYADFANLDLTASDTTDRKYQALRTFQTVLNELDESQVQFDLNRLEYVYRNSSLSNKDTLYINAINHLYDSSLGKDNKALCAAQMASVLFQMGKREESHRWCQIVIELYADTNSASACLQLRQQLEQPELGLQIEQVNLPGQVLLGKLNYRNLGQLYFTVVSWNKEEEDDLRILSNEEQLSAILGKKVIHKGIIKVPSNSDFQSHSTEFKIPALDLGSYLILVSSGPDYVWEKDYIVGNDFLVSRLSYSTFSYEGSSNILCFDRQSGNPLSGVKVSWYQNIYDRQRKMQTPQKITETFSNEMGVAPPPDQRGSFIAALELGEDRLKLQDQYINTFGWNSQKEASVDVMYFLDRSIYRPGQTVQFKGLLLHRDQEGVPSIKPNTDLMVKLYDANGKELSSQKLISNAYGSFYGSFILPESSLAGQFSIGTDLASTRIYFRMESYKRPTFEIELAAKSKTPVLNEDVLVSGRVTSYAGAPLGNINAVYHVVRKVRYPFYSPYARISWQSYPEREIASGTLKTQPDGTFQLIFKAMADDITSLRYAPVCDFEVSVTAIDISGESHQKDLMVSIGSTPFGIQYVGPPVVNLQRDKRLSFKAVNAQGQVVEASGHVMLRLLEDKPWSRQRYWDIPDQLILSQGQYLDSLKWYAAPIDMDTALQEVVSESSLNLSLQRGALTVDLSQVDVLAGRYQLLTTLHDSIGREVETTFEIQVIDPSQEYVPSDELLSVFTSGDTVAVGDTLQIDVAAPIAGEVLYTIERQSGLSPAQWLPIDGWEVLKVPVSRDDQGGIFLHFQIAYQNRILQKSISIAVPWVNKNVSIVTETLRKITEPGSKETVTVKLINDNGNNQNELLVSMFDASLDALYPHQWNYHFFPNLSSRYLTSAAGYYTAYGWAYASGPRQEPLDMEILTIPVFNWFDFPLFGRITLSDAAYSRVLRTEKSSAMSPPSAPPAPQEEAMNEREGVESRDKREITVRENFEENLFFYPDLVSDEDGKVTFDYQMNDALTTWRMMLFAHDKNLSNGYLEQEIVSRKEIMVTSNQPRFLRSGDQISWTSKIDNLTSSDVHTDVRIELKNALNETSLNHLVDIGRDQQLEISAHASASVAWDITIPADFNFPIEVTIIAQTENHQDAERMTIPVLENRTYLTYTKAIELPADSVMKVDVSQLLKQKSGSSTSERMTIDVTSNPTWYALQALPYLMEYPYDCSEQILNQLYANALGLKLVKDNPQIKKIFNQWSEADKQSPLLKNEAFKISAISQTPWLQDALSQTEQIKRLALLFDSNTLSHQQQSTIQKLMERQSADGGFSWFPGGRSNVYISLYVAKGLQTMRSWLDPMVGAKAEEILSHLLPFLDDQMIRYYESIEQQVRRGHTKWEDNHLDANVIYYLNIRNLKDIAQSDRLRTIQNYFLKQAEKYWTEAALYSQIQLAEVFGILEMSDVRALIVNSFRERRVFKPELGVYWNQDMRWRGWWNMPISIQAGMIKLFTEEGDISLVNDAKRWLLNQKRTNHWSSTIATAEAIEALLMGPSGWIEHSDPVVITINGQELIDSAPGSESSLLHKNFPVIVDRLNQTDEIRATNPNNHPAWAAVYYQFFENLDQVKQDKGELEITRELFLETNTDKGALLRPIKNEILNPGDLIVVRMQLTVDRDMDFVQLKDLRSAGLEPVLTLSGYEWEGGLGFYRSNTDRETNFFIDQLPKGKYVFEYRLRVSQHGNFSGGYATVQSMYAPEFSAHSQGTRLSVKIVK